MVQVASVLGLMGPVHFQLPFALVEMEEAVIVLKKYPYVPGSACALNQPPFTLLDSVRSLSTAGGRKGGVVLLAQCDRLIQALFQLTEGLHPPFTLQKPPPTHLADDLLSKREKEHDQNTCLITAYLYSC